MPKVEVPVSFSGTEGFPARRDARYTTNRRFRYPPLFNRDYQSLF
jgi:hypothetical protein